MSGVSADSAVLFGLAEIMKESRGSLAEMQKSHEKAAADQAKTAAELNIKARLWGRHHWQMATVCKGSRQGVIYFCVLRQSLLRSLIGGFQVCGFHRL